MTSEEKDQIEQLPFPVTFSCVDMIVYTRKSILMIKKGKDDLLRIPGGMIDPGDNTNLMAAYRELEEEVNLKEVNLKTPEKIGEFLVADSGRYDSKVSKHRLKSYLYSFELDIEKWYEIKAGDDAKETYKVPITNLFDLEWVVNNILPTHIPMLFTWLSKQKRMY